MGFVTLINEGVHLDQGVEGEQRCNKRAERFQYVVFKNYSVAAWKCCLEIDSNIASMALINEGDRSATAPFDNADRNDELYEVLESHSFGLANHALAQQAQIDTYVEQLSEQHPLYAQAKALANDLAGVNAAIANKISETITIGLDYRGR